MARNKQGRRTRQFNAPGAKNLAQWVEAVLSHQRGSHDAAGEIIHATPASKRREFNAEIWRRRRARGTNPASEGAQSPEQYRAAQAVLHGYSTILPVDVAQEIVDATPHHLRSQWTLSNSPLLSFAKNMASYFGSLPKGKRNPADRAAEAFEEFHGYPSEGFLEIEERIHVHHDLADVGELIELKIVTRDGKHLVILQGFQGARLAMNETANQLFVRGGDQAVNVRDFGVDLDTLHESEVLGVLHKATYHTRKDHLGDEGGIADYEHEFGEENGEMPYVMYDTRNKLLSFSGGSYTIPREGIRN